MATHNDFGKLGEDMAAEYLEREGYTILVRNWRSGHKELDIVAEKDETLVVVEVKTRHTADYGLPEDAVTPRKIRLIVQAADAFARHYCVDWPIRFDVVSITGHDRSARVEHIPDAFRAPVG